MAGKDRIAVGAFPGSEFRIDGRATIAQVAQFMAKNREKFAIRNKNGQRVFSLSIWFDEKNSQTVMDVTLATHNLRLAKKLARMNGEHSIFDLMNFREIKTRLARRESDQTRFVARKRGKLHEQAVIDLVLAEEGEHTATRFTRYAPVAGLERIEVGSGAIRTGVPGEEAARLGPDSVPRLYVYINGSKPEPRVTQAAPFRYVGDINETRLYNIADDPEGLIALVKERNNGIYDPNLLESIIKEEGYSGYHNSNGREVAAIFDGQNVRALGIENDPTLVPSLLGPADVVKATPRGAARPAGLGSDILPLGERAKLPDVVERKVVVPQLQRLITTAEKTGKLSPAATKNLRAKVFDAPTSAELLDVHKTLEGIARGDISFKIGGRKVPVNTKIQQVMDLFSNNHIDRGDRALLMVRSSKILVKHPERFEDDMMVVALNRARVRGYITEKTHDALDAAIDADKIKFVSQLTREIELNPATPQQFKDSIIRRLRMANISPRARTSLQDELLVANTFEEAIGVVERLDSILTPKNRGALPGESRGVFQ